VNGCLIITAGGCGGGPSELPIPFNVLHSAEASSSEAAAQGVGATPLATQKLLSTDEERSFNFESLVGTNNEALVGALSVTGPQATDRCLADVKDDSCRTGETPK
jgi:hypothetical protein